MDEDALRALVDADAALQGLVEDTATGQVVQTMRTVDDWYDHDTIRTHASHAGSVVQAASRTSAAQADAYLTRAISEITGRPATPAGTIPITRPLRDGVRGWGAVYERTAETVRLELSRGRGLDQAVEIGLQRADAMSRTDIALARRQQWRATLTADPRVIGFRRVIHPERSRTGVCGLCIAASDRRYSRSSLLPLHDRCKCTVLPITTTLDPGQGINEDDLKGLYQEAGSTKAADLKKVRYKVVEHGELGPRLVNAEHRTRTPADVRRDTGRRDVSREIAALEKSSANLAERLAAGDETARRPLDWQRQRLATLRREQAAA